MTWLADICHVLPLTSPVQPWCWHGENMDEMALEKTISGLDHGLIPIRADLANEYLNCL